MHNPDQLRHDVQMKNANRCTTITFQTGSGTINFYEKLVAPDEM